MVDWIINWRDRLFNYRDNKLDKKLREDDEDEPEQA